MWERGIKGFYVSRADGTLQLLIFTAPIQFLEKIYIYKDYNSKSGTRIRNASQERDQEPALTGWLLLKQA